MAWNRTKKTILFLCAFSLVNFSASRASANGKLMLKYQSVKPDFLATDIRLFSVQESTDPEILKSLGKRKGKKEAILQGMQTLIFGQTLTDQQLTSKGSTFYWVQVDSGQKVVAVLEKTGPKSSYIDIAENRQPAQPLSSYYFTTLDDAVNIEATQDGYCCVRVDSYTDDTLCFSITAYDENTMPTLVTGQTLSDSLTWGGDSKFYQVKADSGQKVIVALEKPGGGSSYLSIADNIIPSKPPSSYYYTTYGSAESITAKKDGYCYVRAVSGSSYAFGFSISAVVEGAKPEITLSSTTVSIYNITIGSSGSGNFIIKNDGNAVLLVSSISSDNDFFDVSPTSASISPGDSQTVMITFAPSSSGSQSATITINSNDSDENTVTVVVTGNGVSEQIPKSCDFTGDGSLSIHDIIKFLLLARDNPDDPRVDWNGDGSYAINDAIALWMDIINGNCAESSILLSSAGDIANVPIMEGLSPADIEYIEQVMAQLDLTPDQENAFRLALYGEGERAFLPKAFSLEQNYPNPFNPATVITYSIPEGVRVAVKLEVYNLRGKKIVTLVDEMKVPGKYNVYWDGKDMSGKEISSGVYLYRMRAREYMEVRKMVVLR